MNNPMPFYSKWLDIWIPRIGSIMLVAMAVTLIALGLKFYAPRKLQPNSTPHHFQTETLLGTSYLQPSKE